LLGDGLATMFASLVGGPANTTYGENTGVLAITKNYDPSVLRLAAIFAVILGFVAKIGGILSSIPESVMGGISLMLFSMISLLRDGLATMFASLVGGPANTTYGENTGVLAITKNYDPSVLRLAAIFAVILGFVAKIGGILSSIPESVMGGISLMLFSMISLI